MSDSPDGGRKTFEIRVCPFVSMLQAAIMRVQRKNERRGRYGH